jgi:hypothetical protein
MPLKFTTSFVSMVIWKGSCGIGYYANLADDLIESFNIAPGSIIFSPTCLWSQSWKKDIPNEQFPRVSF